MIKHIVVWKMKDEVSAEQKAEMKDRLEALKGIVEELVDIDVGIDESNGTMSLFSVFATHEDLNLYQVHPAHQEVVAFVKPLVAGRTVCDYTA
ncbi:MAG: Dabb family protein [Verrucomicrobia bacterium]|nr:Dabb family protein [Verrucomicrobiota bacterium]